MQEELVRLGLSQKEAEAYLTLLKHPNVSATSLAKYVSYDRRTTYDILHELCRRGYASSFLENGTTRYVATTPQVLVREAEELTQKMRELAPALAALVPEQGQRVEILRGRRGLIAILADIYEKKSEHYAFGAITRSIGKNAQLAREYITKWDEAGMSERVIFEKGYTFTPLKKGKYRFLEKEMVPPTTAIIYHTVVALFLNDPEETIIRIESKEIAAAYFAYFNQYWRIAES